MTQNDPAARATRSAPPPSGGAPITRARWCDWRGSGVEHLVLKEEPTGFVAEAVILAGKDPEAFAAWYRVVCDRSWRARAVDVGVIGDARRLSITADGEGRWLDGAGLPLAGLDGAIDVDFSASPFTNTSSIRRLSLEEGAAAEILVACVRFPDLALSCVRQRYTCVELGKRYRFESLESDFAREIEVDEKGLVVTYPGLFTRTL